MIKPRHSLIWLSFGFACICIGFAIARIYWPSIIPFQWLLGLLAVVLSSFCIADWAMSRSCKHITAKRVIGHNLPVGKKATVELQLSNPTKRTIKMWVIDHLPPSLDLLDQHAFLALPPTSKAQVQYKILPIKRGDAVIEQLEINAYSRCGLWSFKILLPLHSELKIYPDFVSILQLAGLEYDQKAAQMGIHLRQRRGEGMEFRQLRDFRQGDSLRGIDWKATSRMSKLISRDYQDERDQEIVFLLDTGRRLHSKDGDLSHFDLSLNAVILLAYVALNKGDKIGLRTFSGEDLWLPPSGGDAALSRLLRSVYGLHSSLDAPDYLKAASALLTQQKRRAMIVLISNFTADESQELLAAINLLKRKHIVVAVSLREQYLDVILEQPVVHFTQALEFAGAAEFYNQRKALMESLKAAGVHLLDTTPKHLATALVNQYLSLKKSGQF